MKTFTASEITSHAIERLTALEYNVWRQNNLAVKGRKFIGKRGLTDIQGYHNISGTACYCEVKKNGDTLKQAQIDFLTDAHNAGCFCLIACQIESEIMLLPFLTYLNETNERQLTR